MLLSPLVRLRIAMALAPPARAQYVQIESFEVTPFVGLRFGGTFDVRGDQPPQTQACWKDASSYGVAAGVRFDELSLIEFRWTRSVSTLRFDAPLGFVGASLGDVTLNQFHGDFTREWDIPKSKVCDVSDGQRRRHAHGRCARRLHALLVRSRRRIEAIPGLPLRDKGRSEVAAHPDCAGSQLMGVWRGRSRRLYRRPDRTSGATVRA